MSLKGKSDSLSDVGKCIAACLAGTSFFFCHT